MMRCEQGIPPSSSKLTLVYPLFSDQRIRQQQSTTLLDGTLLKVPWEWNPFLSLPQKTLRIALASPPPAHHQNPTPDSARNHTLNAERDRLLNHAVKITQLKSTRCGLLQSPPASWSVSALDMRGRNTSLVAVEEKTLEELAVHGVVKESARHYAWLLLKITFLCVS